MASELYQTMLLEISDETRKRVREMLDEIESNEPIDTFTGNEVFKTDSLKIRDAKTTALIGWAESNKMASILRKEDEGLDYKPIPLHTNKSKKQKEKCPICNGSYVLKNGVMPNHLHKHISFLNSERKPCEGIGLLPAPTPKILSSYEFNGETYKAGDTIIIDTPTYNQKYVKISNLAEFKVERIEQLEDEVKFFLVDIKLGIKIADFEGRITKSSW